MTSGTLSTTHSGDLLVAFLSFDGSNPGLSWFSSVSGGGLSWSLVTRANSQAGDSEIWQAYAPSALSSVVVTASSATGAWLGSMTIVAFSGAAASVGASATAGLASGAPSVALTPSRTGSLLFGVANDWDRAIGRIPASGQSLVHQDLASVGDTYWVQRMSAATTSSGSTVVLSDTAPTSDRFNFAAVEIVAATTGSSSTTTTGSPTTTVAPTTTTSPTTTTVAPTTTTPPSTTPPSTTTTIPSSGTFITNYYKKWANGPDPSGSPSYFPIGVWEQSGTRQEGGIDNAINYMNLGINVDINGYSPADNWPTWALNGSGQFSLDPPYSTPPGVNPAYLLTDEPDMNQVNYGTNNELTAPSLVQEANNVRAFDPSRPTMVNFGKCMSISQWVGCHTNVQSPPASSYTAMMQQYCQAADIVEADYYGYTDPYEPASYHGAWTYGAAIDNQKVMCGATKPVLGIVETGHPFSNGGSVQGNNGKITAAQFQAAAWDMIVHGAIGIDYFVHDFYNSGFTEDGLLTDNSYMKPVVSAFDAQIASLAPILNSVSQPGAMVKASANGVPVTTMLKVSGGHTYLFAIADGNSALPFSGNTTATISVPNTGSATSATVLNESRSVGLSGGTLTDSFGPYQVHIYQIG
jgi:hypothetical protein